MELTVHSYSPLSPVEILTETDPGDLQIDDMPPDPWPEDFSCHLWRRGQSARGVTLSRSGDSFAVSFMPFCDRLDWQLGLEAARALATLAGSEIRRGDETTTYEALSESADADWEADLVSSLDALRKFVASEGTAALRGFLRDAYVGPRVLAQVGEGVEGARALIEVLRKVQFADDDYHFSESSLTPPDEDPSEVRMAALGPEVAYLLPSLTRVLLKTEEQSLLVRPHLIYALLGEWVELLDEDQAYLPPLSPERYAALCEACAAAHTGPGPEAGVLQVESQEDPEPISGDWGPPPAREELSVLAQADQAVRALQARVGLSSAGETLLELGLAIERRADLVAEENPEASLPDYTEAIRQLAKATSEFAPARARLGVAYAKRADAELRLEQIGDARSDFARAAEVLLRSVRTEEGAAHALLVVTKQRVDTALSLGEPEAALRALEGIVELGDAVLGEEQLALALTLRGQASSDEDPASALEDLVAAAGILDGIQDFDLGTPFELAWLAERLLKGIGIDLNEDARTQLVEVSSQTVLRLAAMGWIPLRQLVQTCAGWILTLGVNGKHREGLELAAKTRHILGAAIAQAEEASAKADLEVGLARIRAEEAGVYNSLGNTAEARAAASEALALSCGSDPELQAEIELSCVEIYLEALDPDAALALLEGVAKGPMSEAHEGQVAHFRAQSLVLLDDQSAALAAFEELLGYAEDLGHPTLVEGATATTQLGIAQVYLAQGRLEEAKEVLELALPVLERHMILDGIQLGESMALEGYTALGEARARLGDPEGAEDAWRACARIAQRSRESGTDQRVSDAELAAARARCAEDPETQAEHFAAARSLLRVPDDALRLARIVRGQAELQPESPAAAEACEAALAALSEPLSEPTPHVLRIAGALCEAAATQPLSPEGRGLLSEVQARLQARSA